MHLRICRLWMEQFEDFFVICSVWLRYCAWISATYLLVFMLQMTRLYRLLYSIAVGITSRLCSRRFYTEMLGPMSLPYWVERFRQRTNQIRRTESRLSRCRVSNTINIQGWLFPNGTKWLNIWIEYIRNEGRINTSRHDTYAIIRDG